MISRSTQKGHTALYSNER